MQGSGESRLVGGLRRRSRDERGVALVEFVLVLPLLAVLVFTMIDVGRAFNYWINQTHLASEAARFVAVNKNPGALQTPPVNSFYAYVKSRGNTAELRSGGTSSVPSPGLTVTVCYPNGVLAKNPGDPVRVIVTSQYRWLPLIGARIGFGTATLRATATMRIEQRATATGTPGEAGTDVTTAGAC